MNHCQRSHWVLAASVLVVGTSALLADNWPQWHGPDNNCISKEKNLPTEWSETKNIAWKLKLPGMGSGTPAISEMVVAQPAVAFRVAPADKSPFVVRMRMTLRPSTSSPVTAVN